jgi:hypothetical protein
MAHYRPRLRGKDQPTLCETPIERLLAKAVVHQMQGAGGAVAEGEGEHALDSGRRLAHPVAPDQLKQEANILVNHSVIGRAT